MALSESTVWNEGTPFHDQNGNVLSFGQIYTYAGQSWTVKQATFADGAPTLNTNPIILDKNGVLTTGFFLTQFVYYNFKMLSQNGDLINIAENVGSTQTIVPPSVPVLVSVVTSLPNDALLTWTASTPNTYPITNYRIYRSLDNITFSQIGVTAFPGLTFLDTTIAPNVLYYYYVVAEDVHHFISAASNIISAELIPFPATNDLLSLYSGLVSGNSANLVVITAGQGALYTSTNAVSLVTRTSGTARNLWGVTQAFGHDVVVGDAGTLLLSTNSITWTSNNQGSQNLYGVFALPLSTSPGTAILMAVGANGTILTSQTGTGAWTANTSGVGVDLRSATYLPISTHLSNMWIVGANGTILHTGPTNASGLTYTWGLQTSGTANQLNSIAATSIGGTKIVAVGNNGTIVLSTNTTTWTVETSGTGHHLHGITYDSSNGIFVAIGDSGVKLTSSNGVTWTSVSTGTSNNLYGIYNNFLNAIGSPAFATIAVGGLDTIITSAQPATVTINSGINSGNGPLFSGEMAGYSDGNVSGGPPNYNNGSSVGGVPGTQFLFGIQVQALCYEDGFGNFKNEFILYGSHPQNLFTNMAFTSVASGLLETYSSASATYAVITAISGTYTYWQWNAITHYPFGFSGTHVITFS